MSDYRASIDIPQPREDVFAYLSDFSTTSEWDLGVVEAKRLNGQAVGEGTEFSTRGERCRRQGPVRYKHGPSADGDFPSVSPNIDLQLQEVYRRRGSVPGDPLSGDDPALGENLTNERKREIMRRVQMHRHGIVPLRAERSHAIRHRPDDEPKLLK